MKHTYQNTTVDIKNGIAVVTIDEKADKVNKLSSKLADEFREIFAEIQNNQDIKGAVLISGKPDCFIAGADIEELKAAASAEEIEKLSELGKQFMQQIVESRKPIVAAIHGACMGGGLELALACHYRIATDSHKTLLALPEVLLGLLPGAGGTQRLPRLIGAQKALDLMLTGKNVRAAQAKKMGLVDHVTSPGDGLETVALEAARRLVNGTLKKHRHAAKPLELFLEDTLVGRAVMFKQARALVLAQSGGHYPAPLALLDVVEKGLAKGAKAGMREETKQFGVLSQTSVSQALMTLFFAQTSLKKNRYGDPAVKVKRLSVLGSGLMGAGIAQISVEKDFLVQLKDVSQEALGKGKKVLWDAFNKKVKRGSLLPYQRDQLMSRISPQTHYQHFDKTELVIEAVFEDITLKHKVLREAEDQIPQDCVFASNTSALPITTIAKASKRPENVLGMHYFSPVPKMPLLEIILAKETSRRAAAIAVDVGIRQGKTVIVVNDGPGFYTTRILAPMMDEVAILALEGEDFHYLDDTMKAFGFLVGPITLMDEVGIDVGAHVSHSLSDAFGERIAGSDPRAFNDFASQNCHGRKSGKGFYLYGEAAQPSHLGKIKNFLEHPFAPPKKRKPINPIALEIVKQYARKPVVKAISANEIQDRVVLRMVNEAAYCLQENILQNPTDGDVGAVFGLGFPPFLGGPFRPADHLGVTKVLDKLNKLADTYGKRFAPAALLADYAKQNKRFHQ